MADIIELAAEKRTEFGKGAARRIRRADKVPAVVYGHGTEPQHVTLPGHDTLLALRAANALLNIQIAGEKELLALPKQVQRDPIKGFVEHVDLLIVKRGEKVTVEVPVILTGEAAAETLVNQDLNALALEVDALNIPESLEISIEGLEAGSQITVADIELPAGATFNGEAAETLIVGINEAVELDVESDAEGDEEGAEGDEEAAEGESEDAEGESEGE
ncbi:50S ribosomal protein L25/general stress protein Ctc [Luteococcus peritonei]|uniref:Large ribosomal subunit protein bL25 n=1 Tax=Luteococcus peritonei TaxID=88874 RepID=A0ABW4RRP0_9ACTN